MKIICKKSSINSNKLIENWRINNYNNNFNKDSNYEEILKKYNKLTPNKEIIYQKDPYLEEEINNLRKQISLSYQEKQLSNNKILDLEEEINRLRSLIDKLRDVDSQYNKFKNTSEFNEKWIIQQRKNNWITLKYLLKNLYKNKINNNEFAKPFLKLWIIKTKLKQSPKDNPTIEIKNKDQETKSIKQNNILLKISNNIINYLYNNYTISHDQSLSKNKNSYIIFTINMKNLKKNQIPINSIIATMSPEIDIFLQKNNLKTFTLNKNTLKNFKDTNSIFKKNNYNDLSTNIYENILAVIIYKFNKEKCENILFLFRLLSLLHKIKNPISFNHIKVKNDFMNILKFWIIKSYYEFLND